MTAEKGELTPDRGDDEPDTKFPPLNYIVLVRVNKDDYTFPRDRTRPQETPSFPGACLNPQTASTTLVSPVLSKRRRYFGTFFSSVDRAKCLFERRPAIAIKTDVSPT